MNLKNYKDIKLSENYKIIDRRRYPPEKEEAAAINLERGSDGKLRIDDDQPEKTPEKPEQTPAETPIKGEDEEEYIPEHEDPVLPTPNKESRGIPAEVIPDSRPEPKKDYLKEFYFRAKEFSLKFADKSKAVPRWVLENILRNKAIPSVSLALALGVIAGGLSYSDQKEKEGTIPLGFSEIHQIEMDAEKEGKGIGSRTFFYAGLNDLSMKVFESWNIAHKSPNPSLEFARQIKKRCDPAQKDHYYNLADLFEIVPKSAAGLQQQFENFIKARNASPAIISAFASSWGDIHIDTTHTEWYTETHTSTDENGNTTTDTDMHSIEVYDYTTHYYTYHGHAGEQASASLDALIFSIPDIHLKEQVLTASKTNPEGERVSAESRKKGDKEMELTPEQLKNIANTWYSGSTLTVNEPEIYSIWAKVVNNSDVWRTAKNSAHNDVYVTYSPWDSGPKEFRIAQTAEEDCISLKDILTNTIKTVEETQTKLPELKMKIKSLISAEESGDTDECESLGRDVFRDTQEIYALNFEKGFDVDPFKEWVIALWTLGGLAVGAASGIGISGLAGAYKTEASWHNRYYF